MKHKPKNQLVDIYKESISASAVGADWAVDLRWAYEVAKGTTRESPPVSLRPEVVAALVEVLVASIDGDTLGFLASMSDSKKLAKAARAGLHRLRSRKVDVEVPRQAVGAQGTGIDETKLPASVITAYDGNGQRLVWMVESATKGLMLAQGRLSARHGLVGFDLGDLGRKAYRELVKQLQDKFTALPVEAKVARWYLFDGVSRCEAAGRSLPDTFLRYSGEMGSAPGGDHPALDIDLQEQAPDDLLALYQLPELATWLPETDAMRTLMLQRQEIATSMLYVNEQQRREQIDHRTVRWLKDYLSADRLQADRNVLLDTAHLLQLQQQPALATAARAAADLFEQPIEQIVSHPFIRQFVERLIPNENPPDDEGEQAEVQEKRTDGGLIIP